LLLAGIAIIANLEGVLSFVDRVSALVVESLPPVETASFAGSTGVPPTESLATAPAVSAGHMTPSQPSSRSPSATPGFCDGVTEFCYYLPKSGESWPVVAENTAFDDRCAWPLIANINRGTDGAYRIVGNILRQAGIFVPPISEAHNAWPAIRLANGRTEQIPACPPSEENTALGADPRKLDTSQLWS